MEWIVSVQFACKYFFHACGVNNLICSPRKWWEYDWESTIFVLALLSTWVINDQVIYRSSNSTLITCLKEKAIRKCLNCKYFSHESTTWKVLFCNLNIRHSTLCIKPSFLSWSLSLALNILLCKLILAIFEEKQTLHFLHFLGSKFYKG